jgi:hypothetical protein
MIYLESISVGVKNISSQTAKELVEYIDNDIQNANIEGIMEIINKERKEVKNMSFKDEEKFTNEEALVNIYIKNHPGISYRDAVKSCLKKTEGTAEVKEFASLSKDEVLRSKKLTDEVVYNLSLMKTSEAFSASDKKLLDTAYLNVQTVAKNLEVIVEKQG